MDAKRWYRFGLVVLLGWSATGLIDPDIGLASPLPVIESDGAQLAGAQLADPSTLFAKKKKKKSQPSARESAPSAQGSSTSLGEYVRPPAPRRRTLHLPGDPFLIPLASGLSQPVFVTQAPDNSGRFFVVEQTGRIRIVQNGQVLATPFLDVQSELPPFPPGQLGETGLLGLAFHPNYAGPGQGAGQFFVFYISVNSVATTVTCDTPPTQLPQTFIDVVARYTVSGNPNVADQSSKLVLLSIEDFAGNHNAGMLAFGLDGFLYVGTGDGGNGGDPCENGQRTDRLLGKILRINVNGTDPGLNYAIPPSNPVLTPNPPATIPRREIWDYGFRNPWRFSFDRSNGDLYIGDVGQNRVEEIDVHPSSTPGGLNYGWRTMEGSECYNPASPGVPLPGPCNPGGIFQLPILEYPHANGQCSVTGGYVYRGARYPDLTGSYFYGDFCSGVIWRAQKSGPAWSSAVFLESGENISSFGEDTAGELYAIAHAGTVYRIADPGCSPRPNVEVTAVPSLGTLLATVVGGTNSSTPDNQLFSIEFTQFDNAIVDINGSNNHSTPFSVDLTGAQTSFTVKRPTPPQPGTATTVRFVVTDACGAWPSFVGGGAGAF